MIKAVMMMIMKSMMMMMISMMMISCTYTIEVKVMTMMDTHTKVPEE
jgi:hypothetical protein